MVKLVILPAARADLIDIGEYIARDNPPRVLCGRDRAKIVEIEERLGSFQKRDNLYEGLRHTIHERYLIFFIQRDGEVQIVRVLQGSQPLRASPWATPTYLPPALV